MRIRALGPGTLLATCLALSLSAMAPGAHAGGYLAIDGSSLTLGDGNPGDGVESGLNPRGGRLRLGLRMSQDFDVEFQVGVSSDDGDEQLDDFRTNFAGAYLKGYAPVGVRSALFALAGVAGVEFTRTRGALDTSQTGSGFSFGAGLETELSERFDLSADWMRYLSGDDELAQVDAVSIGLKYYF